MQCSKKMRISILHGIVMLAVTKNTDIAAAMPAEAILPVPGYEGYYINRAGKIFCEVVLKSTNKKAARMKLKDKQGNIKRITIAKLTATCFVPNLHNYPEVIFKDRNKNNCNAANLNG
jgi:hypothetical protein